MSANPCWGSKVNARFGNLSGKPPLGPKATQFRPQRRDTGKRPEYLAAVRDLPCCICQAFGERQLSSTQAHHVFHGRFSQRKTPDTMAIPLCMDHHQGDGNDPTRLAVHRAKSAWSDRYGFDHEYTAVTQDKLEHLL